MKRWGWEDRTLVPLFSLMLVVLQGAVIVMYSTAPSCVTSIPRGFCPRSLTRT